MTKGKKALKGIGITLLVLLILTAIIFGIIYYCLSHWYVPESAYTDFAYLKRVMADDVVYLSEDFISENNLTFDMRELLYEGLTFLPEKPVNLYMNRRNVQGVNDFTKRVKNLESYSYSVKNADKKDMPITVSVRGIAGKNGNITTKCDKKTLDGYKYGLTYGGEIVNNNSNIYKEVVVRTNASKSLINKKNCILTVSVGIDKIDAQNYTEEEIVAKFDEIINSALRHIERYGDK